MAPKNQINSFYKILMGYNFNFNILRKENKFDIGLFVILSRINRTLNFRQKRKKINTLNFLEAFKNY